MVEKSNEWFVPLALIYGRENLKYLYGAVVLATVFEYREALIEKMYKITPTTDHPVVWLLEHSWPLYVELNTRLGQVTVRNYEENNKKMETSSWQREEEGAARLTTNTTFH